MRKEPKRELATDAHGRTQTVKLRGQKGEKARKLGCWKGEKELKKERFCGWG